MMFVYYLFMYLFILRKRVFNSLSEIDERQLRCTEEGQIKFNGAWGYTPININLIDIYL